MLRNTLLATAAAAVLTFGMPALAADDTTEAGSEATPMQGTVGTAAQGTQAVVDEATPPQADMMGDTSEIQDLEIGQDSEMAGTRYGDLEGRTVYSREGTELGTVRNARVNQRGEVDAIVVSGGEGLGPHVLLIPTDMVSPAQGAEADLVADVGDDEITRMREQRRQMEDQGMQDRGMDGGVDPDVLEELPDEEGMSDGSSSLTE
jgi:sporulation protein YlmC with PRC-barrel domain